MREVITTSHPMFIDAAGETVFEKYQYSAAVKAGDFLFVSGQIGLNADGSIPATDEAQFRNAFERLKIVLGEAHASMESIVELVSYHVGFGDNQHWDSFVKVKSEYLRAPFPAWTAIGAERLARLGLTIELKATAYLGHR